MAEVHNLNGRPAPPAPGEPCPDMRKAIQDLMDRNERGELQSLAFCFIDHSACYTTDWVFNRNPKSPEPVTVQQLIGAVETLKYTMLENSRQFQKD